MKPYTILFLCTGNSARSILAEALTNYLPLTRDRFLAYSAGSQPKGAVNPFALELLQSIHIPTADLRSKSWDEFARPDAPHFDFIITVCGQAAGEQCPYWPGQPITAHWGLPDPAAVSGNDEMMRKAFADALHTLRPRIELLASLPLDKLDHLALRDHMHEIGKQ